MIVVTGGTGLLGSHLLFNLTSAGNSVRAIYRNPRKQQLVLEVFRYYSPDHFQEYFNRIEWVEGDMMDIPSLDEAFRGMKLLYHCAGMVSFNPSHFQDVVRINREGTANVVNCALAAGIQKLCHVSSTAAIGGKSGQLTTEKTKWENTPETSGYAIAKYSAEKEVWRGIEEGLNAVIVNPCVIFGAGNWNDSSLAIFKTLKKGLRFYTPGKNAIVDARDVAEIMTRLMESSIKNERFLCIGTNIKFSDLFTKICQKAHFTVPSVPTPKWLSGFAWRLAAFTAFITRKEPLITKETVVSAYSNMEYDNSKVKKALDFEFRSLDDTIDNALAGKIEY